MDTPSSAFDSAPDDGASSTASRPISEATTYLEDSASPSPVNPGKPFDTSGLATIFKKPEVEEARKKLIACKLSPSPALTRDFGTRRKTILNSFCLSLRKEYDKDSYKLYHHTLSHKAKKMYNAARDALEEDRTEAALNFIQKAMLMRPDDPDLYILRGEVYLRMCDFKSAIMNYKRVCILDPDDEECFSKLAFIYFLQGQCFYDEQLYIDALECFTRAAEMEPENSGYHSRSLACLVSLKRHKDCMKMINERLEVESTNPDLFILRAKLHIIFSNPTLSYFDVKEALSIDPNNIEADCMHHSLEEKAEAFKETALKLDMAGKTKEAILKITLAIDTNPSMTLYYLLRACMHRRNLDFNSAVDDLMMTMDKCNYDHTQDLYLKAQKQLLLTFNDFAVDCFRRGFFEEAVVLLEKSIQGEKDEPLLYVNRGDCFYKLNHLHFALLDYQQAQELDPNNQSIAFRLSIVYNDLGLLEYAERKYYRAEDYFSLAIAHDCRNASFYMSRSRARYMQEKTSEAQVDIISVLYLDKNNKETQAIFVRLFPNQTKDEVLSSEFAVLVQEALQSVIEENFQDHTQSGLSKKKPLHGIEARKVVQEKITQCMLDQDFHVDIIKGKKKVNELVENVIQARQNLTYNGPKPAKPPKTIKGKTPGKTTVENIKAK